MSIFYTPSVTTTVPMYIIIMLCLAAKSSSRTIFFASHRVNKKKKQVCVARRLCSVDDDDDDEKYDFKLNTYVHWRFRKINLFKLQKLQNICVYSCFVLKMSNLNIIPINIVSEPVVGRKGDGQQCNGNNGGYRGQR